MIKNYKKEKVFLTLEVKKGLKNSVNIEIKDEKNEKIYERKFPLNSHKYAQLLAWGDGQDYELEVKSYIRN